MRSLAVSSALGAVLTVVLVSTAGAQQVVQARGVDSRVDYATLVEHGPWDDRNYRLNADDVALLPANDVEHRVYVPAFYRIELRRLIKNGEDLNRYPRSSLPRFMTYYGGYLVDGRLYSGAVFRDGRYEVQLDGAARTPLEFLIQRVGSANNDNQVQSGAAESAVTINPTNNDLVAIGYNSGGQRHEYSTDGGTTWTNSSVGGGGSLLPGSCCDPTFAWKSDGSRLYGATLDISANDFYISTDSGATWTAGPSIGGAVAGTDKEFLHADNHPGSAHQDNVYMTWHENNIMFFASLDTDANGDPTATGWGTPLSFSSAPLGIGSDITTDRSGNVYYLYPAYEGFNQTSDPKTIVLLKSTDGGASFGSHSVIANTDGSFIYPVPSMDQRQVFIYVSADTDLTDGAYSDRIYAAWSDSVPGEDTSRIQVAYSSNGGTSWTQVTPHSTADQDSVDRYHQWLEVDENGVVHLIYYTTDEDASNDRDDVGVAYQYSVDGGQNWSAPTLLTDASSADLTDSDPFAFEFGDYNALDVVMNNLVASYTDTRGGSTYDVFATQRTLSGLDVIFEDGFESGSTSAWSSTTP